MAIVIDSLTKLLLPVTVEKTHDFRFLYKNPRRDIKLDFANGLHEKRREITLHDENNFDFSSVQITQSLASI